MRSAVKPRRYRRARALARTIFYTTTLAVPARRDVRDPQVLQGKQLFHEAQCASCHVPRHLTGQLEAFPELSGQTIFPYGSAAA